MYRINSYSPGIHTSKVPDLKANHKIAQLQGKRASLEEEVAQALQSILALDLTGKADEQLQGLIKQFEQLVDTSRQLSRPEIKPEDVLLFVKRLPDYRKHPMDVKEESLFIKIEEALNDFEIIPAKISQLNRFQLGILWHAHDTHKLSDSLFHNLIAIKIKNIESKKIGEKEPFVEFEEINGAIYKRAPLRMCAEIHNALMNGADQKAYTIALERFHKRLEGIKNETIEKRLNKLTDRHHPRALFTERDPTFSIEHFDRPQVPTCSIRSFMENPTIDCFSQLSVENPTHLAHKQQGLNPFLSNHPNELPIERDSTFSVEMSLKAQPEIQSIEKLKINDCSPSFFRGPSAGEDLFASPPIISGEEIGAFKKDSAAVNDRVSPSERSIKYYPLTKTTMECMALFLPDGKKHLLSTEVSMDDLLRNGLKENNLFKIMEESLSTSNKISEIKKRKFHIEFQIDSIMQIHTITSKFLKKESDPIESIKEIKKAIKNNNQKLYNDENESLKKFELIGYYFDQLDNFVSEKFHLNMNKFAKIIFKITKENRGSRDLLYQELKKLKSFSLRNQEHQILIYNEKDVSNSPFSDYDRC